MRSRFAGLTSLGVLLALTWGLGVILPERLIGSGVEDFEGLERRMAEAALADVELNWGTGLDALVPLLVAKRVVGVEKCPGTPSGEEFEEMVTFLGGFSAEVRLYTLFGLHYGTAVVGCGGVPDGGGVGWRRG